MQPRAPKILLAGQAPQIADITRDELSTNCGRDIAGEIHGTNPDLEAFLVPRIGDENPAEPVRAANEKAIEWKSHRVLGSPPSVDCPVPGEETT